MPLDTRLHGIYPALVTPLEPDGLTVNAAALRRVIDYVLEGNSAGIVVLGGTGEYTALSMRERERAVDVAVEHVHGRAPVVVGIVSPGLGDAVQMAQAAARSGADYIMPITPYYVVAQQTGLIAWYQQLAEATTLPIILYNIPSRTGVNLQPSTVLRLTEEIEQIVGIKECNTSLAHVSELIALAGERLAVLSGEDHYALPEFVLGARGAILASANAVPAHWSRLYRAVEAGAAEEAQRIYRQLVPFLNAVFAETNPGPLKVAMQLLGFPVGPVARPLLEPRAETQARLREALKPLAAGVAAERG